MTVLFSKKNMIMIVPVFGLMLACSVFFLFQIFNAEMKVSQVKHQLKEAYAQQAHFHTSDNKVSLISRRDIPHFIDALMDTIESSQVRLLSLYPEELKSVHDQSYQTFVVRLNAEGSYQAMGALLDHIVAMEHGVPIIDNVQLTAKEHHVDHVGAAVTIRVHVKGDQHG